MNNKRAMKVTMLVEERTHLVTKYICPSCKTHVREDIDPQVTRFKCLSCDRELIISKRKDV